MLGRIIVVISGEITWRDSWGLLRDYCGNIVFCVVVVVDVRVYVHLCFCAFGILCVWVLAIPSFMLHRLTGFFTYGDF